MITTVAQIEFGWDFRVSMMDVKEDSVAIASFLLDRHPLPFFLFHLPRRWQMDLICLRVGKFRCLVCLRVGKPSRFANALANGFILICQDVSKWSRFADALVNH